MKFLTGNSFHTEAIDALKVSLSLCLDRKETKDLKSIFNEANIADISNILKREDSSRIHWVIKSLSVEDSSKIITFLPANKITKIFEKMSSKELKEIIEAMPRDDAADIVENLPVTIFRKILSVLDKNVREDLNTLLSYENDLVGSIMYVDFVDLNVDMTVTEASNYLRDRYEKAEEVRYYYVTDRNHNLEGIVDVQKIFFSKKNTKLSEIIQPNVINVGSYDPIEKAIEYFKRYDLPTLPVISKAGELIGVVTYDDLIDVVEEEATEDIQKQAGITPTQNSYVDSKAFQVSLSRVSWLIILLVSATLSQIVLTIFQSTLTDLLDLRITALLISLLPVISGTAGNAGSQSTTSVVRSMALRELKVTMYKNVLVKETKIALYVGLILSAINTLRMLIFYGIANGEITLFDLILTASTSLCLVMSILLAKLTGSSLPFLAILIKKDPAAMAAPLLTTLVDAVTTAIFFGLSLGVLSVVIR